MSVRSARPFSIARRGASVAVSNSARSGLVGQPPSIPLVRRNEQPGVHRFSTHRSLSYLVVTAMPQLDAARVNKLGLQNQQSYPDNYSKQHNAGRRSFLFGSNRRSRVLTINWPTIAWP